MSVGVASGEGSFPSLLYTLSAPVTPNLGVSSHHEQVWGNPSASHSQPATESPPSAFRPQLGEAFNLHLTRPFRFQPQL